MTAQGADDAQLQQAEAARYADLLNWGTRVGMLVLIVGFASYTLGLISPFVSLQDLPQLWNQPVATFQHLTGSPTGWGWLKLISKADMLNLLGIAILAGASLPPLLGLFVLYVQRRDWVYAALCASLAAVQILAASGILGGGH